MIASPDKVKTFINGPGRFFHYDPLFTSFIRLWRDLSAKILIISEGTILCQKSKVLAFYFILKRQILTCGNAALVFSQINQTYSY